MSKFVVREKMSKKARKELDSQRRHFPCYPQDGQQKEIQPQAEAAGRRGAAASVFLTFVFQPQV